MNWRDLKNKRAERRARLLRTVPIEDMELSVRSTRVLKAMGCQSYADVLKLDLVRLFAAPGLGIKSVREIRDAVEYNGDKLPIGGELPRHLRNSVPSFIRDHFDGVKEYAR